ncbi:MAG: alpha/beta fold hydrolase [Paracoccaceae bacterium]
MTADLPTRVWARGGARPLLALHCSLAHGGAWAGVAAHLQGVTVTAPDLPGHGRAADWDGLQDMHAQSTRSVAALAQRLGQGAPIDLMGHSFGGTICLRLAVERPDLVRSLILVEPVLFAAAAGTPAYTALRALHAEIARILQADPARAAAMFHAEWGSGEALDDLPQRQRAYIIERIRLIPAVNPVLMDDAAGLLRPGVLEGVTVPATLIDGGASPPVIDAIQSALIARLPQTTRLTVPGAGHMVPITHPQPVAGAIQTHLSRS